MTPHWQPSLALLITIGTHSQALICLLPTIINNYQPLFSTTTNHYSHQPQAASLKKADSSLQEFERLFGASTDFDREMLRSIFDAVDRNQEMALPWQLGGAPVMGARCAMVKTRTRGDNIRDSMG